MKFFKSDSIKFLVKISVSIILLILIIRFIGIDVIYNELLGADMRYILISTFFVTFLIFFKAMRWNTIVNIFNKKIDLSSSLKYTLISHAFGIVTPGRIGEFIKAKYLADRTKIGYLKSIITVVFDKIFDVITVILFALIGLALFKQNFITNDYFVISLIVYSVALAVAFSYSGKVLKSIKSLLSSKYKKSFGELKFNKKIYLNSMMFSALIWLTLSIQAFFILSALNLPSVSFYAIMIIVPLMALSSMLPISIGGIGLREVVAMYFFLLLGIQAEKSVSFSLIYTFLTFGIPAMIGAVFYSKKK
jgi:glycosyltransferase 2 family protein